MAGKYVYFFGEGKADGKAEMKNLLGGKGSNLAEMTNLGIRVPAGFTISTEVCTIYYEKKGKFPDGLEEEVKENLKKVEKAMAAKFGDTDNPLLVSVRSGARVSMPGMMDTVLNLGLNDETVKGLIKQSGNKRFAYDCYRRFVQMYGDVVLGLKPEGKEEDPFEVLIDEKKKKRGVKLDTELNAQDLEELVREFKALIKKRKGVDFPDEPWEQLWGAIAAVFRSWDTRRAIEYRRINKIPSHWGTAVNVQTMVYGNLGEDSGTGVAFTRDPATGDKRFYGEYLLNAQGEDVVAGIRTPHPINKLGKKDKNLISLEEVMPGVYKELEGVYQKIEEHYKDMQDIEFTVQKGKLYLLQTRTGKRTGFAAVRIAVEMVEEGLIDKETALMRVEPGQLVQLLSPIFGRKEKEAAIRDGKLLSQGLNASPGAASGKVVFAADEAVTMANSDDEVILVRLETSPEDIQGINVAQGILTARGGMTSHAAVVARGMGKPCVVGCGAISIDYQKKKFSVNGRIVKQGDYISIDGTTGEVIQGKMSTYPSEIAQVLINKIMKKEDSLIFQHFSKLMEWADSIRRLGVRTNADTPKDSKAARDFGAEGIGLCRTEHMFFEGDRIDAMREMIVADDSEGRRKALAKLLPMQRQDFTEIFKAMHDLPVIIRTLDPPLHEFLPHTEKETKNLAKKMNVPYEKLQAKVTSLHEMNPMLGHRGCRLGITYPEITEMQARAIFEAACEVNKQGVNVIPEVMIPLVGDVNEFVNQKKVVLKAAEEVMKKYGVKLKFLVGTMIEIPRACLTADEISREAEFFSFGTNDLTQMCFGFSRDDAQKFLAEYMERGILKNPPFHTLDQKGVGELIKIGIEKGRKGRPDLEVGICGEHGGDPQSVKFCHRVGMNYVSCSPYRVPVARLSAAQAVLEE
ncbi:MAG: pyruvate, phosphate dikinase [Elusimicrobiota bacterium]|nr:pyruvate, phosphate dikinase [Elusimicrobiota bacterium]